MVFIVENEYLIQVQILNETLCTSHSANILGKGMYSTIFPPMGK